MTDQTTARSRRFWFTAAAAEGESAAPAWYDYLEQQRFAYLVEVRLQADPAGGYTAWVPELPGIVSEGDDLDEALERIAEAATAALEQYRQEGRVPWRRPAPSPGPDEVRRWIVVRV